jgi:CysZ protein
MWRAFSLSVKQLRDPAILWVLAKSLSITLLLAGLLGWGSYHFARTYAVTAVERWGYGKTGGWIADAVVSLTILLALILMFRAIAVAVLNVFADEVVMAVEAKHYPAARLSARRVRIGLSLKMALLSAVRVIGVNLLFLPAYLFFLVVGVGPFLFFGVNALLFGRDLGEMVAVRHLDPVALKTWLGQSRFDRALLGLAVTALFMIPVVTIIVPLIGAAMATHIFHAKRGTTW